MRGLTLIEMLVVLSISTVAMGVLINSVVIFYRSNAIAVEQQAQTESARRGVDKLVADMREATYGDDGSFPIFEMGSTSVTIFSDTDGVSGVERVRYSLVGTTLYRHTIVPSGQPPAYTGPGATTTVSDYIRNFEDGTRMFRYYNAAGVEVTSVADIASVVYITTVFVVDVTRVRAPGAFTLKSSATIRNLRQQ